MSIKQLRSTIEVLIVDDEECLRETLQDQLELFGFNITTASSGNKAFDLIKKNDFQIVLSDVKMPDGDGIVLLERIRENNQNEPALFFLTGFAEISSDQAIAKGAAALFQKPCPMQQIVDSFDRWLQDDPKSA